MFVCGLQIVGVFFSLPKSNLYQQSVNPSGHLATRDVFLRISSVLYTPFPAAFLSTSQPNDMDYDPYDALLHHVYQQVRRLNQFKSNLLLTFYHLNRLKVKHGSGLRKNPSQQVSVLG
jgi:hypothetical protein